MTGGTGFDAKIEGASSVLVLGPAVNAAVDDACVGHLPSGEDAYVIAVNFSPSPDVWLDRYASRADADPAGVVLVTTNESAVDADAYEWPVGVEGLSTPGDLTGIGMIISKYLERWHDRGRVALCFDSLTALLQYEEPSNVYRFLHIISTRLAGAGATAHFHLDPATQDAQTVSTLRSPFEAVASFDDGEWTVKRR